eukprot:5043302-Pyramimonas_sp.AAC.1
MGGRGFAFARSSSCSRCERRWAKPATVLSSKSERARCAWISPSTRRSCWLKRSSYFSMRGTVAALSAAGSWA